MMGMIHSYSAMQCIDLMKYDHLDGSNYLSDMWFILGPNWANQAIEDQDSGCVRRVGTLISLKYTSK